MGVTFISFQPKYLNDNTLLLANVRNGFSFVGESVLTLGTTSNPYNHLFKIEEGSTNNFIHTQRMLPFPTYLGLINPMRAIASQLSYDFFPDAKGFSATSNSITQFKVFCEGQLDDTTAVDTITGTSIYAAINGYTDFPNSYAMSAFTYAPSGSTLNTGRTFLTGHKIHRDKYINDYATTAVINGGDGTIYFSAYTPYIACHVYYGYDDTTDYDAYYINNPFSGVGTIASAYTANIGQTYLVVPIGPKNWNSATKMQYIRSGASLVTESRRSNDIIHCSTVKVEIFGIMDNKVRVPTTEVITIYPKKKPYVEKHNVAYLNEYGTFDYYVFDRIPTHTTDINRTLYVKDSWGINSYNYHYEQTQYGFEKNIYEVTQNKRITLVSDYMTDVESAQLQKMFKSPTVLMYDETDAVWHPVIIDVNSIEKKTTAGGNLINYEIPFIYSVDTPLQFN